MFMYNYVFYLSQVYQEPSYKFSASDLYYIPDDAREYAAFVDYVKCLPIENTPIVFGLHHNADISKAHRETAGLFEGVLKTLPKEVSFHSSFRKCFFLGFSFVSVSTKFRTVFK